ncbi:basic helix-loop-helix protein 80-like [Malus domestica]|uniref:basic helix-loop-helix protein 80-like n=1 Tax=Malus domestica TaxID=3750 RepID=UPI003975AD9F
MVSKVAFHVALGNWVFIFWKIGELGFVFGEEGELSKQMNKKQSKVAAAEKEVQFQTDGVRVKARRGRAIDSHITALLKGQIDYTKITGKARILDEIITYVQLLKNQVECLAAQLAQFPSALEPSSIQFPLIFQDGGSFVTWRMLD